MVGGLAILFLAACGEDPEPVACPSHADASAHLLAPALGIDFYMDRYEASRYDASASSAGNGVGLACSSPGVLPWTGVSYDEARSACAAVGKHLCTSEEWLLACRSLGADSNYPYSNQFELSRCNGDDGTGDSALAATGAFPDCQSLQDVFDLSGNAREWVSEGESAALMGGSFASGALDLSCGIALRPSDIQAFSPGSGDGFRCCGLPQ